VDDLVILTTGETSHGVVRDKLKLKTKVSKVLLNFTSKRGGGREQYALLHVYQLLIIVKKYYQYETIKYKSVKKTDKHFQLPSALKQLSFTGIKHLRETRKEELDKKTRTPREKNNKKILSFMSSYNR
jgi:hypothetical protein